MLIPWNLYVIILSFVLNSSFLWSFLILLTSDSRGFLTTSYIWKGEIRSGRFQSPTCCHGQKATLKSEDAVCNLLASSVPILLECLDCAQFYKEGLFRASWLPYSTYLYLDFHLLSRRWRLHTGGSKMFKLLFQAGMNVLNQSFCRICMSSE